MVGLSYILKCSESGQIVIFYPEEQKIVKAQDQVELATELNFACSKILELLVVRVGDIVTRDELFKFTWRDRVVSQNSLNQSISVLREQLDAYGVDSNIIVTIPRRGYRINIGAVIKSPTDEMADIHAVENINIAESSISVVVAQGAYDEDAPSDITESNKNGYKKFMLGDLSGRLILDKSPFFLITILFVSFILKVDARSVITNYPLVVSGAEGQAKVSYISESLHEIESLRESSSLISERLLKLSSNDNDRIVLSKMHDYFDIICISSNYTTSFITVHKSKLDSITDMQLKRCIE